MRGVSLFFVLMISIWSQGASAAANSCEGLFLESSAPSADLTALELSRPPNDLQNGLVTDRLPINVETLSAAYTRGIFPWDVTPQGNGVWFTPPKRGILDFDEIAIGRSDEKILVRLEAAVARGELRVTYDTAFERVIEECANQRRLRRDARTGLVEEMGTWISPEIIRAFTAMHKVGRAHSVEVWRGDELVGGMYGTTVAGIYSGESMFHKLPNVAKLSFSRLIKKLKELGYTWVDTQVAPPDSTSLTVKWGAREISRDEYLARLKVAAEQPDRWPAK